MRRALRHSGSAAHWYHYSVEHERAVELLVTDMPMTDYRRDAAQLVEEIVDMLAELYRLPD